MSSAVKTVNGNAVETAGGEPANGNKNGQPTNATLNKLNVNARSNKETFANAFRAAAEMASGFDGIPNNCTALANALVSSLNINLGSNFGNYGSSGTANQTIAAANLNKVKTFTESQTTPTRAAILVKILQEIKKLVKNRRNRNRNVSGNNIKTPKNFNDAIVRLINAVNKARKAQAQKNEKANNQQGNE